MLWWRVRRRPNRPMRGARTRTRGRCGMMTAGFPFIVTAMSSAFTSAVAKAQLVWLGYTTIIGARSICADSFVVGATVIVSKR